MNISHCNTCNEFRLLEESGKCRDCKKKEENCKVVSINPYSGDREVVFTGLSKSEAKQKAQKNRYMTFISESEH